MVQRSQKTYHYYKCALISFGKVFPMLEKSLIPNCYRVDMINAMNLWIKLRSIENVDSVTMNEYVVSSSMNSVYSSLAFSNSAHFIIRKFALPSNTRLVDN